MAIRLWQLQRSMLPKDSNGQDDNAQRISRIFFFTSLGLNLLLWVMALALFPKDSSTAVLHYTAGVGIDFIGDGWQIITLPAIGILLFGVNVLLARAVQRASDIAFWILWCTMPLLQILLLLTYALLFELNT